MPRNKNLRLQRVSPELCAVDSKTPTHACCAVIVTRADGRPAQGAPVRFRIVDGPLRFRGARSKSVVLETDRDGRSAPTVVFTGKGKAVVIAFLEGTDGQALAFQPYTEGMAHQLFVYASGTVLAADGCIAVSISAIDHWGEPVGDASLSIFATKDARSIRAKVVRKGSIYSGTLETRLAGCWTVVAKDQVTGARAKTSVEVLADKPKRLRVVGDPDPRLKPPYNQALVRAMVLDRFRNQIHPGSIVCKLDQKVVKPRALVANEAHFLLDATGAKTFDVSLHVKGTRVRRRVEILSAAAWIGDPGLVLEGKRYGSPLYLTAEPARRVTKATIKVGYDAEQVTVRGFRPNRDLSTTVEHDPGKLKISVTSKHPIGLRKYPEGIQIGYIDWQCLAEGETCVNVVAAMSPDTPAWEKCTNQKKDLHKNVCINLIYNAADDRLSSLPSQVSRIRRLLDSIFNDEDTIKTCCPFMNFTIYTTGLGRLAWLNNVLLPANVTDTDGSGTLDDPGDSILFGRTYGPAIGGTKEGVRANCVNFYLVDFHPDTGYGANTSLGPRPTDLGSSDRAGFGAIDPDFVYSETLAHELGHALGMEHDPPGPEIERDTDELMHSPEPSRTDTKIKRERDCQEIWENIDTYYMGEH